VLSPAARRPRLAVVRPSPVAELDDAGLARAAIEGAPGAAAAVWDRFSAGVRSVLRRILGPGADVEDQVQETFVQFFEVVRGLRDLALVRSFLIGIGVRLARSELRRRRVRRWLSLTDTGAVPEEAWGGVDADAREAVTRLYALLDRLDDRSRTLFVLRHVEGLELEDTAAAMGISLATTKRYLVKVVARVHAMAARDPLLAEYLDRTTPLPEANDG
jgi:RNA polymerase sigma-70 factor, ECF subfamily